MKIKLLIEGGNMEPGPAIAQKIGPLGINMGKVIKQVNSETEKFKGIKVPVEIDVDPSTKEFEVQAFSPPVSELIKKELGLKKGGGAQNKLNVGNLAIEEVIKIADTKHKNMLDKTFKSAVKSVVGSCISLGVLVETKSPKEVEKEIDEGKYDEEINNKKTEVDEDKRKKLDEEFKEIKEEQEAEIEKEEAEKEAEEKAIIPVEGEEPAEGEEGELGAGQAAEAPEPEPTE